jgi:hypothetical protein
MLVIQIGGSELQNPDAVHPQEEIAPYMRSRDDLGTP